jgi:hypothetical protein
MTLKDIERQKTWVRQCMFTVRSVGVAVQSQDNGSYCQAIEITDTAGREDVLQYYFNDLIGKVEFSETGEQSYDVKWMGDWFKCKPALAPPKENLNAPARQPTDWDAVNLGKCRHGILCAVIRFKGMELTKGELNDINELAHFSMTGEIE